MANRKKQMADRKKEERKGQYVATLQNVPTSTRKMRLVADTIRGKKVEMALATLKFSKQAASNLLEKLLRSAINNWEQKTGLRPEDHGLFVKEISVDQSVTLKRFLPAPQGRANRLRKRSNHVTLKVDSAVTTAPAAEATAEA